MPNATSHYLNLWWSNSTTHICITWPQWMMVFHYDDVIMTMLASQITSLTVVYSIVYSDVNQRKHQSSASLAFVREIHRGPVNFPHKWPVTRKMFPFDDVIMVEFPPRCRRWSIYDTHSAVSTAVKIHSIAPFVTINFVLLYSLMIHVIKMYTYNSGCYLQLLIILYSNML